MEVREIRQKSYYTLIPVGEVDASSSLFLSDKISNLIQEGHVNIHIDCSELRYISSAGLGVFMAFQEDIKKLNGKMIITNLSPAVYSVFELLGIHLILTILPDNEQLNAIMR